MVLLFIINVRAQRAGKPRFSGKGFFRQRHGLGLRGLACRLDGAFRTTGILHHLGNLRLGQPGQERGLRLPMAVHVEFQGSGQLIGMGEAVAVVIVLGLDGIDISGGNDGQQFQKLMRWLFQQPFPQVGRIAGELVAPCLVDAGPFGERRASLRLLDRRGQILQLAGDLNGCTYSSITVPGQEGFQDQGIEHNGKGKVRARHQLVAHGSGADRRQLLDERRRIGHCLLCLVVITMTG